MGIAIIPQGATDLHGLIPQRDDRTYYGLSIDGLVNRWIATIEDKNQLQSLLGSGEAVFRHCNGRYKMKYMPGKLFSLRLLDRSSASGRHPGITIYDLYDFVQAPLAGDYETSVRAVYKAVCDVIELLFGTLKQRPRLYGPGSIAGLALRHFDVAAHRSLVVDSHAADALWSAYYAGRIETRQVGEFDDVVAHDINSAYPAAMANLPRLAGCDWRRVAWADRSLHRASVWRVEWNVPEQALSPFPCRISGATYWLPRGSGWYWRDEVDAALALYGAKRIKIQSGYEAERRNWTTFPFAFLRDWYQLRKELKRDGRQLEAGIIKLTSNTIYGKLVRPGACQSIIFAGMATADIRARMLELASRSPEHVIALATDGVLATARLARGAELGAGLGDWSVTDAGNVFYATSGIYEATAPDGTSVQKTRGFADGEIDMPAVRALFRTAGPDGVYRGSVVRRAGIHYALAVGDPDMTGREVVQDITMPLVNPMRYAVGETPDDGRTYRLYQIGEGASERYENRPDDDVLRTAQKGLY